MSTAYLVQITDEVLKEFIGKEITIVTTGDYYITGILNYNNALVYDEYKYSILSSEDNKTSYYVNVDDIQLASVKI